MKLSTSLILSAVSIFLDFSLAYDDNNLPPGGAAGNFVTFFFSNGPSLKEYIHYPYVDGGAHCCPMPRTPVGKDFKATGAFNTSGSIECKFFVNEKCDETAGTSHSWHWEPQRQLKNLGWPAGAYACRLPLAGYGISPVAANYLRDQ